MLARLSLTLLPLLLAAGCASTPGEEPKRTSQLEAPQDCPTGTRVCRRGGTGASSPVSTISADDLQRARAGSRGAPGPVVR